MKRAEEELQSLWRTRKAFLAQMRTLVERQATELEAAERWRLRFGRGRSAVAAADADADRANASATGCGPGDAPPHRTPVGAPSPRHDPAHGSTADSTLGTEPASVRPTPATPPTPVRPSMPTPSWLEVVEDEDTP